jgi:hypothetical protein
MKIILWALDWVVSKGKYKDIVNFLLEKDADVVFLSEYLNYAAHVKEVERLVSAGYICHYSCEGQGNNSWVRVFFAIKRDVFGRIEPDTGQQSWKIEFDTRQQNINTFWGRNWLGVKEINGLDILGVHIPDKDTCKSSRSTRWEEIKNRFWIETLIYAQEHKDKDAIIIGDFNECLKKDNLDKT